MNDLILPALIILIAFSLVIYLMEARRSCRTGAYSRSVALPLCFSGGIVLLCGIGYMPGQRRKAEEPVYGFKGPEV